MEDHIDDCVRRDNAYPERDKMEADSASFGSSTKLANGDDDDVTMAARSLDDSVSSS